jgi:integrase
VLDVRRKGDRPARVPLPPATAVALVEVVDSRSCGPLFVTGTGGRFDDRAARRLLAQLGRAGGVPADRAHPHALRHSFVTLALDAGVPLQAVQDAADHADPRTTRGYDRRRAGLDGHPSYALSTFLGW